MVATADQLATQAGMTAFSLGGNAVDAAIAANAAIAVTGPHLCGMGGDLFALVHFDGQVFCLNSSGRAGSGADAGSLRAEGLRDMPFRHDIRVVTVPGCVDGWVALHQRFGTLPLETLLAPAIHLAEHGFPASPLLAGAVGQLDPRARATLSELSTQARRPGARVTRAGVASALRAVAAGGRDAFYLGTFGEGLRRLGDGWFNDDDLATPIAEWVTPLAARAWDLDLWTVPPNSQGYLTLAGCALAERLGLPADPDDVQWAHLTVEAAKAVAHDRPAVLHEHADGPALLAAATDRARLVNHDRASTMVAKGDDGDTTYLCTTDHQGNGVSLIQSNAAGFGSWLVEPNTGINLHNRGLGFSLQSGHPAELRPRARPPHTLSPALATEPDGRLRSVFGTMGGDGQPQILLQLATRLFHHGQSPAVAMRAGRWVLRGPQTGFDTWTTDEGQVVRVEANAPADWVQELLERGHRAEATPPYDSAFGHANAIVRDEDGFWSGAADPRAHVGSVAGG